MTHLKDLLSNLLEAAESNEFCPGNHVYLHEIGHNFQAFEFLGGWSHGFTEVLKILLNILSKNTI